MHLSAPAKINLRLQIHGRRADGFHEIETVIVPISLEDEIVVEISSHGGVTIVCDEPAVPADHRNLVAMAAQEFSRHTGLQFGARIEIQKRIPMGAGLGGGSSDAAAVLLALDAILDTGLGSETLERVAAKIGSDVPFFIRRLPAICRGRGEIIEPFNVPEPLKMLLIKPPFSVETSWAYKAWATSRSVEREVEAEQDLSWIKLFNSLERPVFEKFFVLPVIKGWLRNQPEVRAAAMSGSGSTLFALLHHQASGSDLAARAKAMFGEAFWIVLCDACR